MLAPSEAWKLDETPNPSAFSFPSLPLSPPAMGFTHPLPLLFVSLLFLAAIPSFSDSAVLPSVGKGDPAFFEPTRVTQLSWHPRAFLYKGFLSDEECNHLISLARDKLEKSMVADNDSGKSVMSEVRTSSGMFLEKYQAEKLEHEKGITSFHVSYA